MGLSVRRAWNSEITAVTEAGVRTNSLEPHPFQQAVVRMLREDEPEIWEWFASDGQLARHSEAVRMDLLKSTYRIEPGSDEALYADGAGVLETLGLDAPLTFYQYPGGEAMNASLAYLPGQLHVVLTGPVSTRLASVSRRALIAHEAGHFLLNERWDGQYLTASRVLEALAWDPSAEPVHAATARRFDLFGEVFCDRVSRSVCQELSDVVAMLVAVETSLENVSGESFLRQVEEVFAGGPVAAEGLTHPETYIRARALQLWDRQDPACQAEIERMLRGPLALESLDLLSQKRVATLTRRLIRSMLSWAWMQTDATLSHARLFFEDFQAPLPEAPRDQTLATDLASDDERLQEYYAYVLLDFVAVERELDRAPLAAALTLAGELGFGETFEAVAAKELKLTARQIAKTRQGAGDILARPRTHEND